MTLEGGSRGVGEYVARQLGRHGLVNKSPCTLLLATKKPAETEVVEQTAAA